MKVKRKEVLSFFDHVSDLISVGITIREAIKTFKCKNKEMRTVVEIIKDNMDSGYSFSMSLKKTDIFPPSVIVTIKAGEDSGHIEESLKRIREKYEEEGRFVSEIKKAILMPLINIVASSGLMMLLIFKTIPTIAETLRSLGNIPPITQTLFNITIFLKENLLLIIMGVFGFSWYMVYTLKESKPDFLYDTPLVGKLIKSSFISSLFSQLEMMVKGGISITDAIKVIESSQEGLPKKQVSNILLNLSEGKHLDESLSTEFFPEDLIQKVRVIRETGKYEEIFSRIASTYKKKAEDQAKKITTLIEPASIFIVGIVVFTLMVSVFLPMATLGTGISQNLTSSHP
ncbi:MAG: type II secretion system F family protein [Nitrospirota bacterium]